MPDDVRRAELAAFLRARREAIRPEAVGLPSGVRRRTPGLRREEVAQRAAVGVTWYTWLEQGRPIVASPSVIDALAGALLLTHDEHNHLRRLAGLALSFPPPEADPVEPRWRRLVDEWGPNPAAVINRYLDLVVWNETYQRLSIDPRGGPGGRPNILTSMFHPESRTHHVRWADQAHALLARFRYEAGKYPGDPRFQQITDQLSAESPEFRAWWPLQAVQTFTGGPQDVSFPTVGVIRIEYVTALLSSDPDVHALLGYPVDPEDRSRLHQFLSMTTNS